MKAKQKDTGVKIYMIDGCRFEKMHSKSQILIKTFSRHQFCRL